MITHHAYANQARRDIEYWLKQGYAVGVLRPGEGDFYYSVYVDLLEGGER